MGDKNIKVSLYSISADRLVEMKKDTEKVDQKLEVSNQSYIVAKDQKIEKVEDFSSEMFALVTINGITYKVNFAPTVKAEGEASKYELAKPFLVSLPLYTSSERKHNVTISPKSEVKKIPNEKPVVPPSEKPKEKPKAETGISTNSSILTLLAVLLTASAGAYMISQKEEEAC